MIYIICKLISQTMYFEEIKANSIEQIITDLKLPLSIIVISFDINGIDSVYSSRNYVMLCHI